MFKVVVVDDEPLILRSVKKSIQDAHTGFKIVGEAINGKFAIDIIEETLPDVVFTDIRMPVLDGLALIEELIHRGIQSKVVILSGYQEFDYAKRALKFGVADYLLKPIDREKLSDLLCKIYNDLDDLKNKNQVKLLESMVSHYTCSIPLSTKELKYFESYRFYGSILICSGSYCTFSCNWITPAKDFWFKTDLNAILDSVVNDSCKYWILELGHGNDKLVILASYDDFQHSLRGIYEKIFEALGKGNIPITIAAGNQLYSLEDLPHVIQYYKIILKKSVVFGNSSLILPDSSIDTSGTTERLVDINSEKLLAMFTQKKQSEQFKNEFKKLLTSYNEKRSPQLRLASMVKYLVNMFEIFDHHPPQKRFLEIEMEIDELISNSFTYQSLYDGMSFIFDDLFYFLRNQNIEKSDHEVLADKVEYYIKQNYSQQISLQSIAENFNVVLPFLSRIFKRHKGFSPMEFIIHLRIEKVKELLQITPPLTLKEIAQAVGYDDPFYMSRIFKSVAGKSPSEYRSSS